MRSKSHNHYQLSWSAGGDLRRACDPPLQRPQAVGDCLRAKGYGFDTGFVCYHRGWQELRSEDMGLLWEHFVLNEIMTRLQSREIGYWRDKRGHEVDFILAGRRKHPLAVECKWSLGRADKFDPVGFEAFRTQHPEGDNVVIAQDIDRAFTRSYGLLKVRFESLSQFASQLV